MLVLFLKKQTQCGHNMESIAFIGLGNMGLPMARNLLQKGYKVTGFDLVSATVQSLASQGATPANTATQAVQDTDVIISMLPAGKHVVDLYTGKRGVLNDLKPGSLIIDCSTIDAESVQQVANAANLSAISFMDAPVSGGITGAEAGTLSFMCGGAKVAYDRALPILQSMGKNVFHAGNSGAGQVAKMCNNMLLSVIMIGTSEALKLGLANNMDARILSNIMQASTGRNWALETYNPCPGVQPNSPSSNDYRPGFMVDLMCKDLKLASDNASKNNVRTLLSALAKQLYDEHQSQGNGQLDFTSIFNSG